MTTSHDKFVQDLKRLNCERNRERNIAQFICYAVVVALFLAFILIVGECFGEELTASYYSIESLKKEGTYAYSHGQMANGRYFSDDKLTAAAWAYPLGTIVRVTNKLNGKSVVVEVTDRTARRFAKTRIDLSISAMYKIDGVVRGLVPVTVKEV
jgi:rare lipoprotein A